MARNPFARIKEHWLGYLATGVVGFAWSKLKWAVDQIAGEAFTDQAKTWAQEHHVNEKLLRYGIRVMEWSAQNPVVLVIALLLVFNAYLMIRERFDAARAVDRPPHPQPPAEENFVDRARASVPELRRRLETERLARALERSTETRLASVGPVHFEVLPRSSIDIHSVQVEGEPWRHSLALFLELMIDNSDSRPLFVRRLDFEVIDKDTGAPTPSVPLGTCGKTLFCRTHEVEWANDSVPDLDERGLEIQPGAEGRGRFYASAWRDIPEEAIPRLGASHFLRVRLSVMGQSDVLFDLEPTSWPRRAGQHPRLRMLAR